MNRDASVVGSLRSLRFEGRDVEIGEMDLVMDGGF